MTNDPFNGAKFTRDELEALKFSSPAFWDERSKRRLIAAAERGLTEPEKTVSSPLEKLTREELVNLADGFTRLAVLRADRAEKRERAWRDAALAFERSADTLSMADLCLAVRAMAKARALETEP
jgi:hypothetical protein